MLESLVFGLLFTLASSALTADGFMKEVPGGNDAHLEVCRHNSRLVIYLLCHCRGGRTS